MSETTSSNSNYDVAAAIAAMPVNSFYPEDGRQTGEPYVEHHRMAFALEVYTVWHDGMPLAIDLTDPSEAAAAYLKAISA